MLQRLLKSSFIKDVASLTLSRFFVSGLSFLASIMLARWLGPGKQGIISTLMVVPTLVMSFADLGMRQAGIYFLGKQIYKDQEIISTVTLVSIFTSLVSTCIAAVVYYLSGYPDKYGILILWIPIIYIPIQLLYHFISGVLVAKQKIQQIAISNSLQQIVYIILLLPLFWIKSYQAEYAMTALVISAVVVTLYTAYFVSKYGRLIPAYVSGLPWQFLKLGFVYGIALFILGMHYRVDVWILERLSDATEVGIYTIGVGVAEKLWLLPAALTTVVFARSSVAKDAMDYAHKTARILRFVLWAALIPCFLLYVLAPWLIPLVYGQAYLRSGIVVQAILPGIWAALVFKILNSDLAGRGRPDAALWVYALSLLINICLNLWWVPLYGAYGSAWASSVTYVLGAVVFGYVYSRMSKVTLKELFIIRKSDFDFLFTKRRQAATRDVSNE